MTTDWHDVVNDPDVQAISVTGPNGKHLEVNRAIAEAHKPILCEKPVGRFPEETLESYRAAQNGGVMSLVGYNYRWAPLVQLTWHSSQRPGDKTGQQSRDVHP